MHKNISNYQQRCPQLDVEDHWITTMPDWLGKDAKEHKTGLSS